MFVLILAITLSGCEGKSTVTVVPNPNVTLDLTGDPHIWHVATWGDDQANTCHHAASPCRTVQAVIDRAASGDQVIIADGVYSGRIEIGELDLTIEGSGPNTILEIPSAEGEPAWGGGVLYIHCDWCTNSVKIANLTVRNGRASNGGAIFVQRIGLTLENVTLRDSTATRGGCLFVYSETTATLDGVVLDGCQGSDGGGINNNGILNVAGSELRNNTAADHGGALFNTPDATATLSGSLLEGNTASQFGGAILNAGDLTLSASTLQSNQPDGVYNQKSARILATTLRGHLGAYGAALENDGYLYLYNVTISGNEGAGILARGSDHTTSATSLTIAQNAAEGIWIRDGGTVYLVNTLLANNGGSYANVGGKLNCSSVVPIGGTHNLSSDDTCDFASPGNTSGVDPKLGPLQDNGGPTWTHQLLPGSPALDSGAGMSYSGTLTDQRGVPRPIDGNDDGIAWNDVGAFEADPKPSVPSMTVVLLQTPLPPPRLFTPNEPSNCRQGPGVVYPGVASLPAGVAFVVDGRNEAGDWLRLWMSDDASCWVKAGLGKADGELTGVAALPAPPTPTPTTAPATDEPSLACSSYGDKPSCISAGCAWVRPLTGGPESCQ